MHRVKNLFERFIEDSYACRVGKGTHAAMRRALHFARGHRYALKCDVQKYFPSIDHAVLMRLVGGVDRGPEGARALGGHSGQPRGCRGAGVGARRASHRLGAGQSHFLALCRWCRNVDDRLRAEQYQQ